MLGGQLSQTAKRVERRNDRSVRFQSRDLRTSKLSQAIKNLQLAIGGLLVSRENFFFVLFQFRRDVTLGVLQRLLADKVVGDFVFVRVGDFKVVAKDFREPNFEAGDSGRVANGLLIVCLLYTSPSPRDRTRSRMPSSA